MYLGKQCLLSVIDDSDNKCVCANTFNYSGKSEHQFRKCRSVYVLNVFS